MSWNRKWAKALVTHSASALAGATTLALGCCLLNNTESDEEENQPKHLDSSLKTEKFVLDASAEALSAQLSSMSPLMPITKFRPNPNLEIVFDSRTRNPLFVTERIMVSGSQNRYSDQNNTTDSNCNNNGSSSNELSSSMPALPNRARMKFYEETSLLPPELRSRNGYYRNSGYDRGHLAPAADFRFDEQFMMDTFSMCNISPQAPLFNRKIWSRLEALIRTISKEEEALHSKNGYASNTYVITGPLWLPSKVSKLSLLEGSKENRNTRELFEYSYVGFGSPPSLVSVPTHFFKVVVTTVSSAADTAPGEERIEKFAAFVLPNIDEWGSDDSVNLQDYLVRFSDLESVSGMQFFPHWIRKPAVCESDAEGGDNAKSMKSLADSLTEEIWMELGKNTKLIEGGQPDKAASVMLLSNVQMSKNKKAKLFKVLQETTSIYLPGGMFPLQHLCANGRCSTTKRTQ